MNRFNKVLLLIPTIASGKNVLPFYPLPGVGYLAEVLLQNNIPYVIWDMRLDNNEALINREKVDFIGVTMMSFHYLEVYHLISRLKKAYPHLTIAVGGPHISTFQEQALLDCPEIDFGFIQEGEESLLKLIKGKPESEIPGLIFREDSKVKVNPKISFVKDLDNIPFPTYKGFALDKYLAKQIALVTSRGCPYECVYCPIKTTIGQTFRARTPENILKEVQFWYGLGYRELLIQDDNFTLIPQRVIKLCQLLKENQLTDITFRLPNGIRADKLSLEMLQIMKEVGFKSLAFGVEAGNDKILNNIKKGEKLEEIKRGIELACQVGFDVALFFIIGSPEETVSDLEDSVRLALAYPVKEVNFYNLIPFPRTELFTWAKQNGYLLSPPEIYLNYASHFLNQPVLSTPQMNREERIKAFSYTQKISKIVKRRGISEKLKKKWGIISKLTAYIYVSDVFQNLYWENKNIRLILDKIKSWLK